MKRHHWGAVAVAWAIVSLAVLPQTAMGETEFVFGDHTYQLVTTARTWTAAAADATGRQRWGVPGALVRIDSQAENDAISAWLQAAIPESDFTKTKAPDGGGGSYVWLGATDRVTEGAWLWDGDNDGTGDQFWSGTKTGSPVGGLYNNWGYTTAQNEPDNYNGAQDAAGICLNRWPTSSGALGSRGQWNDVNETNSLYYIVEFDAVPEPTALAALCGALPTGILWCARRRRARR